MEARLKLRLGDMEVEWEGNEAFVKDELAMVLAELFKVCSAHESSNGRNRLEQVKRKFSEGFGPGIGTTTNLAVSRNANSGADLAICAAIHLTIEEQMPTFTRKQLLDEMKSASSFYKTTYSGNLTSIINTLLKKDDLREVAKDTYGLSQKALGEAERIHGARS